MQVNFNYQINGQTNALREPSVFPLLELVEYRVGGLDYAIARLGPNEAGQRPGDIFGTLPIRTSGVLSPGDMLYMIQHPAGNPKMVEAGPLASLEEPQLTYDSLDTQGGASGAPVILSNGIVVGIHTKAGFKNARFRVTLAARNRLSFRRPGQLSWASS